MKTLQQMHHELERLTEEERALHQRRADLLRSMREAEIKEAQELKANGLERRSPADQHPEAYRSAANGGKGVDG